MGEYATIDGTGIKLGTMDDWRYVRYATEKPNGRAALVSALPALYAKVIGERFDAEGNGRTIFGCIYCDKFFSLPESDIAGVEGDAEILPFLMGVAAVAV